MKTTGPPLLLTAEEEKKQRELADKITSYAPLDDIRILLACGAQVNAPVVQGLRPLHYAVYSNNVECVRLLLIRGADLNAVDEVGYSPLHLCAEHGSFELVSLLIEEGARVCFVDPDEKDPYPRAYKSEEPLRLAIKNGHYDCARLLLESGANPNAPYFLGSELNLLHPTDVTFMRLLLMYGADPNVYDREGLTPLMKACRHRDGMDAVELLVKYAADVNALALPRQDLRTPLHYCLLNGSEKLVTFMLAHGANVNMIPDYDKPGPLDLAVLRDQPNLVRMLLEGGGDPNSVYTYIGSPMHLACCSELNHQIDILTILLMAGGDPNLCPMFQEGYLKSPMVEYFRSRDTFSLDVIHLLLAYGGQIVMQSPITNPKGMLRNLLKAHNQPAVFDLLLEAGQDYSLQQIDRLTLPIRRRLQLVHTASRPMSLQQITRMNIRNQLMPLTPQKVANFPIPRHMKASLLFVETLHPEHILDLLGVKI